MKESALANTALFAALTEEQRALIAERMVTETRRSGDLICATGKPANAMYLISVGSARLMTEQFTVLANLGPGSMLGEADVLLGRAFTVTAEAASDVTLLALSAADLAEIIQQDPEIGRQLRIMAGATDDMEKVRHLRRLNLMAGLGSEHLRDVAQYLRTERFVAGQGIYCRGTFGSALYLIDQGQVTVQRPGQRPALSQPGAESHPSAQSAIAPVQRARCHGIYRGGGDRGRDRRGDAASGAGCAICDGGPGALGNGFSGHRCEQGHQSGD